MGKENSQSNNMMLMWKIFSLVLIMIYSSYYYFTRSYIANIKEFLIVDMKLTAAEFSKISAAFSIGYSLCQVFGGYLLDKFSIRFLLPILLIFGSIASYIFIFISNIQVAEYSRYILGMCFCLGSIGSLKYLSIVWTEHFSVLVNAITILMSFAAALAASGSVKLFMAYLGWKKFLIYFTSFGVLLAVMLFFILKIVDHKQFKDVAIDKNDVKEIVPFGESLKNTVTIPGFIYVAIYCITIPATSYLLMDGYGNTLVLAKFPYLTIAQISLPAYYNMIGSGLGALANIILQKFAIKTRVQMLFHGIMSLMAVLTLVFLNPCFTTMLVCFFILGFNSAGASLSFTWLQKHLHKKYQGLGFGFLNFLCMFFGCAVIQRASGVILDYVKSSAIKAGVLPYEGYTYYNILTMFKFMLVLNFLSIFSAFVLKDKKR